MKFYELEDGREQVEKLIESARLKRDVALLEKIPYLVGGFFFGFFVAQFVSFVFTHLVK